MIVRPHHAAKRLMQHKVGKIMMYDMDRIQWLKERHGMPAAWAWLVLMRIVGLVGRWFPVASGFIVRRFYAALEGREPKANRSSSVIALLAFLLSSVAASAVPVPLAWRQTNPTVIGYRLYQGPISGGYDKVTVLPRVDRFVVEVSGRAYLTLTSFTADYESEPAAELFFEESPIALCLVLESSTFPGTWTPIFTNPIPAASAVELFRLRIEK